MQIESPVMCMAHIFFQGRRKQSIFGWANNLQKICTRQLILYNLSPFKRTRWDNAQHAHLAPTSLQALIVAKFASLLCHPAYFTKVCSIGLAEQNKAIENIRLQLNQIIQMKDTSKVCPKKKQTDKLPFYNYFQPNFRHLHEYLSQN